MAVAQNTDWLPARQLGYQFNNPGLWGAQRLILAYAENLVDARPLVSSERLPLRLAKPLHQSDGIDRRRLAFNIGR